MDHAPQRVQGPLQLPVPFTAGPRHPWGPNIVHSNTGICMRCSSEWSFASLGGYLTDPVMLWMGVDAKSNILSLNLLKIIIIYLINCDCFYISSCSFYYK